MRRRRQRVRRRRKAYQYQTQQRRCVLISSHWNANIPSEYKGPVMRAAHSLLKENITGTVWAGQCFGQVSWRKNLDNFEPACATLHIARPSMAISDSHWNVLLFKSRPWYIITTVCFLPESTNMMMIVWMCLCGFLFKLCRRQISVFF